MICQVLISFRGGLIFNTTISNCTYSGFVHSSFDSRGVVYCYVGGICGYAYDSEILNCANYSEVYHYEWLNYGYAEYAKRIYTGGLCGSISNCTISNCTNKGNVGMQLHEKDNAKGWVGGICGLSESSSINNCYNTSAIGSASNNLLIGGICAGGKISNSYNIGNLIGGSEGCSINGIGGKSENSFYLSGVALKDNGEAKAKSKTNMQMPEFAKTLGDAFVYVEGDYPKLAWELGILMTGDINNDGKIDISDAVLLQKYLLGVQQFTKEQGEAADIYQDGFIDAFDMVLMRQLLISQL